MQVPGFSFIYAGLRSYHISYNLFIYLIDLLYFAIQYDTECDTTAESNKAVPRPYTRHRPIHKEDRHGDPFRDGLLHPDSDRFDPL